MTTATARRTETAEQDSPLAGLLTKDTSFNARPEVIQMRLENEVMMAECRAYPRDYDDIKTDLMAQLKAFPDLATDAIYEKPVGRDPETGQQKYARGLSIRAAETLAEAYGYNRIRSDVSELEGGDKVKIEATFTDFQKGRIWQDAGILSKTYKDRSGKIQRHNDDRFYNVICKAEVSKRVREVITRSVNAGLKAWFESECEKIAGGLLDDKTVDKIAAQFATKNVTKEMLETLIGRPQSMGWTQADRQRLLSVWNALKDGETTVAEVFEGKSATALPPDPGKGAPTMAPQLAKVRETFAACKDAPAIDYERDELLKLPDLTPATREAIELAAAERRREVGPKGKAKQGELVK